MGGVYFILKASLTKPGLPNLDLALDLDLALVTINVTPGSNNRTCGSCEAAGCAWVTP